MLVTLTATFVEEGRRAPTSCSASAVTSIAEVALPLPHMDTELRAQLDILCGYLSAFLERREKR